MAPTAPRPTPHKDALLDRTGIIGASGNGPPPTPGMNRSGVAGFVAFVVMVFAAVTGVSELERGGEGSRLIAGDEVTEGAVPPLSEGAGPVEQRRDDLVVGADRNTDVEPAADTEVPAAPRSASDAGSETPDAEGGPAEAAVDVPADGPQARGLGEQVPNVAQADAATQAPRIEDAEPGARKPSLHRRIQLFGDEIRRSIRNHADHDHDFGSRDFRNHSTGEKRSLVEQRGLVEKGSALEKRSAVEKRTAVERPGAADGTGAVDGQASDDGHAADGRAESGSAGSSGAGPGGGESDGAGSGGVEAGGIEALYDRVLGGAPVSGPALRVPEHARTPKPATQREQAGGASDVPEPTAGRPGTDDGDVSAGPGRETPTADAAEHDDAAGDAGSVRPSGGVRPSGADASWMDGDGRSGGVYEYEFGQIDAGQADGDRRDGGAADDGPHDSGSAHDHDSAHDRGAVHEYGTYGVAW
ncbi:hypothetical protein [Prauserella alba]|uniref:Uncharacterized protein n=1 Tax=Prauserella alba TaxID=176898 RepID=A0ABP4GCS7_9PSEU|nr:hypothetical protein [Prauserella alba]MCP2182092.1 hypothetical protein [Prauserella alba]